MTAANLTVVVALPGDDRELGLVSALEHPASGYSVARRCVDVPDLLAVAASGVARIAVIGGPLLRLDREVIARLTSHGVAVVGVAADVTGADHLRSLGVTTAISGELDAAGLRKALREAPVVEGGASTAYGLTAVTAAVDADPEALPTVPQRPPGRMIVVWGPTGAPGRTTVAINLADELARLGRDVVLIDADTHGPSVAQALAILDDDVPGVAAAARLAHAGRFDDAAFARTARAVSSHLRVLTGLPRADRWPELRPASMEVVWEAARRSADVVVVDAGFGLEQDEELAYDTLAPRRNAVTLGAIEAADVVLAVGTPDPVGLRRLIRGLDELEVAVPEVADVRIVINRSRRTVVGGSITKSVGDAIAATLGERPCALLPNEPAHADAALLAGRTLAEVAPRSTLRAAIRTLAVDLDGRGQHRAAKGAWGSRVRLRQRSA